ncbi:hypothetical protein VP1G_11268 [Cytospora mali]|uniref:Uncharacterized protein n=1 Tax=Cytospora mali TaxID=578113 RepID=A0A194VC96_CYTMA|nr:hypothetical protein VP1G_11268 [Valsa mali var. pyri (nom. inval.)]
MPLAMFPASPVVEKALPAMLDAWLNLSQREKARELVIVRAIAITMYIPPDEHEAHQGQYRQGDPEQRLDVVGEPEEAAVGRVDGLGPGLAALKHPLGVARGRVHLVPPAQPDESAAGDVLQVVEVGGEEEDRDDEDQDAVWWVKRSRMLAPRVKSK